MIFELFYQEILSILVPYIDRQSIYGSATVSDNINGCWRPICSVFGTAALC